MGISGVIYLGNAGVMELADITALEAVARKSVGVQISPPALKIFHYKHSEQAIPNRILSLDESLHTST